MGCIKSKYLEQDQFVNAYKWISNQMKKRIGNPPKCIKYPVWAWYLYEGKNKRPDMRHCDVRVNEKSVLWEIEIPDNEVLLTDEEAWHLVLGDWIIYKANYIASITDEKYEIETHKEDELYNSLPEEQKKVYRNNSWEQIICTSKTLLPYIQATFWELKESQIKKTWILKK